MTRCIIFEPILNEAQQFGFSPADIYKMKITLESNPLIGQPHPLVPQFRRLQIRTPTSKFFGADIDYVIAADKPGKIVEFVALVSTIEPFGKPALDAGDAIMTENIENRVQELQDLVIKLIDGDD